jgi:hypothetical protein
LAQHGDALSLDVMNLILSCFDRDNVFEKYNTIISNDTHFPLNIGNGKNILCLQQALLNSC